MAEAETHKTTDHRTDQRKNGTPKQQAPGQHAAEDLTPVPTQAELDALSEGENKDNSKRAERAKPPEALPPTPTQEEANEQKAALYGTTLENEQKLRESEKKQRESLFARDAKDVKDAPEDLTPTPTQEELDEAKKDVMYMPEGSGDPQKLNEQQKRKQLEADKTQQPGYQTRAVGGPATPAREHTGTPAREQAREHPPARPAE